MGSWVFLPECRHYANLAAAAFIDEYTDRERTLLSFSDDSEAVVTDPRTRALIHEYVGRNLVRFDAEAKK